MVHLVLAEVTASVSELKKNPMGTVAAGEGAAVAILNRNEPAFYCVPANVYEALMDQLEEGELARIAEERLAAGAAPVKARINGDDIEFDA